MKKLIFTAILVFIFCAPAFSQRVPPCPQVEVSAPASVDRFKFVFSENEARLTTIYIFPPNVIDSISGGEESLEKLNPPSRKSKTSKRN